MNKNLLIIGGIAFLVLGFYGIAQFINNQEQGEFMVKGPINIVPISHATMVLHWNGKVIYVDPTGGKEVFAGQPEPDLVLITDIHGDHFDAATLQGVVTPKTITVLPRVISPELPDAISGELVFLDNGNKISEVGFSIEAIPMYNLPESDDAFHVKGRGNGYVLEAEGKRVYIAGDTAGIPEMRALQNIDMAFIPMNLPYTMSVEDAAEAVLAFKPKTVYPYHYRGPNTILGQSSGFADVQKFKTLVHEGDSNIEVVLLDWYTN